MNNEDLSSISDDEIAMWESIDEDLEGLRVAFQLTPVESKQEAIDRGKRPSEMPFKIHYRDTSQEFDSRDYYLELGRSLLPLVERGVEQRLMSPRLIRIWGMMKYCHGFIATYMLDDVDGLSQHHLGKKSGRSRRAPAQQKWVASIINAPENQARSRYRTEGKLVDFITDILSKGEKWEGFPAAWFRCILNKSGTGLASSFTSRGLNKPYDGRPILEWPGEIPPLPIFPR